MQNLLQPSCWDTFPSCVLGSRTYPVASWPTIWTSFAALSQRGILRCKAVSASEQVQIDDCQLSSSPRCRPACHPSWCSPGGGWWIGNAFLNLMMTQNQTPPESRENKKLDQLSVCAFGLSALEHSPGRMSQVACWICNPGFPPAQAPWNQRSHDAFLQHLIEDFGEDFDRLT